MFHALIVEDEPLMREYLMANLSAIHGMWKTTGCARDGVEAMELLKSHAYDLVITDIKMPRMDGLELANYVHTSYPATDIIILTGYSEFDFARSAVRAGAADYLLKPLQDSELHDVLHRLADKRSTADSEQATAAAPASEQVQEDAGTLVRRAREYVRAHFQEPISLCEVAEALNVNPAYLSTVFKSEKGESYSKYLLRLRMERAAVLLRTYSAGRVNDIASEVGYSSPKHFYAVFKDYYGITPAEYRKQG